MTNDKPDKSPRGEPIWPAEPPTFQPAFPQLQSFPTSRRLLIPVGTPTMSIAGDAAVAILKRGQPLTNSPSSPLAPSDGRTGEIVSVTLTSGKSAKAIEFFPNASEDATGSPLDSERDLPTTLDELINRLRPHASIDRRDTPELLSQLHEAKSRPVDTIACSVLDADSALRINGAVAARHAGDLVSGIKLLIQLTSATRGIIAVETNSPGAWVAPVRQAAARTGLELIDLENDYPQADPTLLLYSLIHRKLSPASLPPARSAIVLDADAAVSLYRYARRPMPDLTILGIRDHLRARSHFLLTHTGTLLADLLDGLDIRDREIALRGGDLLRDVRLPREAVVGGSELAIHISPPEFPINPDPCIRSGWCMDACPTLVQPAHLLEAAQRQDRRMAEHAGIDACIECGLCTYVCPSRLPILQSIRYLKREVPPGTDPRRWKR
jgi:Na+-translocating ferredoxin:NAD+ oxidoreductase subunit C